MLSVHHSGISKESEHDSFRDDGFWEPEHSTTYSVGSASNSLVTNLSSRRPSSPSDTIDEVQVPNEFHSYDDVEIGSQDPFP